MSRRSGYPVVLVDYFEGTALPSAVMECLLPMSMPALPGAPPKSLLGKVSAFVWGVPAVLWVMPTLLQFVWRHVLPAGKAAKLPLVESVAAELQGGARAAAPRKLGLIGYCYGGDSALHFNALECGRFAATAVAHGEVPLSRVATLRRPALFVCAENDFAFPAPRVLEAEALVRAREDYSVDRYRFRRYAGTYHGFAIRGDERNKVIEKAKGEALDEAIDFFKAVLG